MRSLVLIDLDSVIRGWHVAGQAGVPLPQLPSRRTGYPVWLRADDGGDFAPAATPGQQTVMVVAMNSATATETSWDHVQRFCRRLAALLSLRGSPDIEIALTLPMPQTADAALLRLLSQTPISDHAGSFHSVWLVSQDRDICSRIEWALGGRMPRRSGETDLSMIRRWLAPVEKPGLVIARRQFELGELPECGQEPLPAVWSARVNTPGRAVVASWRPVDVATGADLRDLGQLIGGNPCILSQIGLTATSTRGVARLRALLDARPGTGEPPMLGVCTEHDGLEVHHPVSSLGQHSATYPESASVGIGAVYIPSLSATVRTKLPLDLLRGLNRPVVASFGPQSARLDDDSILRSAHAQQPPCAIGRLAVRLATKGNTLVAQVSDRDRTFQPSGWWLRRDKSLVSPKDSFRIEAEGRLLPRMICDVACGMAPDANGTVLLMSLHRDGHAVRVNAAIAPRTIGLARSGTMPVALLASSAPIPCGTLPCTAIQRIDVRTLLADYPGIALAVINDLRRLPLVVPFVPTN